MSAVDSSSAISPEDRDLMRRLTIVLLLVFGFVAAFTRLDLLYSHKFFDVTGNAQWIWDEHVLSSGAPLAFFATHDFDLPDNRYYTRIKILGDPEYTLYFNGQEIGGRRVGEESVLDVYDVTKLARSKGNRIVVAVRSPTGVGGLIASIDLSHEAQNVVVTGKDWKIIRDADPALLLHDPAGAGHVPLLLGRPPARRWNYLTCIDGKPAVQPAKVLEPSDSFEFKTARPDVKVISGVAVAVSTPVRATAYDFGFTRGRLRLTRNRPENSSSVVDVRFANTREELFPVEGNVRPFTFASDERTIVDSEVREFRYALVYGDKAKAEVMVP